MSRLSTQTLLLFLLVFSVRPVRAQTAKPVRNDRAKVAQAAIAQADAEGDVRAAVALRLERAATAPGPEAAKLLDRALRITDSIGDTTAMLRVLDHMHARYARTGRMKEAYRTLLRTDSIRVHRATRQLEQLSASQESAQLVAAEAIRHAEGSAEAERIAVRKELERKQGAIAWWRSGVVVLALVLLLVVVRNRARRPRALPHAEVAPAAVPNVVEPPPPVELPADPIPEVVLPLAPVAGDEGLLQLLRKRGPERLETLRDARLRGDEQKVVRVVHTLKPLLSGIDPLRFASACTLIVAPGASADQQLWNSRLDDLELAIRELLERDQ